MTFTPCANCGTGLPSPSRLYRYLTSTLCNSYTVSRRDPLLHRRISYYDEATNFVALRYTAGLEAGEPERTARAGEDWTRNYDFWLRCSIGIQGGRGWRRRVYT